DLRSLALLALPGHPERDQRLEPGRRDVQLRLHEEDHRGRPAVPARPRPARGLLMRRLRLVLILVAACRSTDFDPASYVSGARVLAVKAEPPEVAPGESSTLTALNVDTEGRPVALAWYRCLVKPLPDRPIADECVTGDTPSALMAVGNGSPLDYTMPVVAPADLGLPDSTGGFYVPLIARATAGDSGLNFGYRLRLASGGQRNPNPVLASVAHDQVHPKGASTAEPDQPFDEGAPPPDSAGPGSPPRARFPPR